MQDSIEQHSIPLVHWSWQEYWPPSKVASALPNISVAVSMILKVDVVLTNAIQLNSGLAGIVTAWHNPSSEHPWWP
jgi:hypothetical protein